MSKLRTNRFAALAAMPLDNLCLAADAIVARYPVSATGLPRAGLRLLTVADSVTGEDFYLGEIPIATAMVALTLPDGGVVEGGAEIMGDSEELATALAIIDAALSHDLPGAEAARGLLAAGLDKLAERDRTRAVMLARTRVDFSLMSEA